MQFELIQVIEIYERGHSMAAHLNVVLPDAALEAMLDS